MPLFGLQRCFLRSAYSCGGRPERAHPKPALLHGCPKEMPVARPLPPAPWQSKTRDAEGGLGKAPHIHIRLGPE